MVIKLEKCLHHSSLKSYLHSPNQLYSTVTFSLTSGLQLNLAWIATTIIWRFRFLSWFNQLSLLASFWSIVLLYHGKECYSITISMPNSAIENSNTLSKGSFFWILIFCHPADPQIILEYHTCSNRRSSEPEGLLLKCWMKYPIPWFTQLPWQLRKSKFTLYKS